MTDRVQVPRPNWYKTGHFGDVLSSQSLGVVLKKQNLTQQSKHYNNSMAQNIQEANLNVSMHSYHHEVSKYSRHPIHHTCTKEKKPLKHRAMNNYTYVTSGSSSGHDRQVSSQLALPTNSIEPLTPGHLLLLNQQATCSTTAGPTLTHQVCRYGRHYNLTRHTASTSMYSLTFCVRVMLP